MTIDEHIKHIQGTIEWAKAFGGEDDDDLIIYWTEQLEMLEELKWYREQDLIRREDASRIISTCEDCCKYGNCLDCEMMRLYEIPKAEPPKEER